MMENLLEEILAKAEEDGDVNTIVKEVEENGQGFRNKVEEALKSRRQVEEANPKSSSGGWEERAEIGRQTAEES